MLELLLRFVFEIIANINNIIATPIVNVVVGMFPDTAGHFENILAFFEQAFTYLTTILRWLLITQPMMLALFDYFFVKWSVWIISCGVRFAIKMYDKLKP